MLLSLCAVVAVSPAVARASGAGAGEVDNDTCLGCHNDPGIKGETERGKTLKLTVTADALKGSKHEGQSCTDCHGGAKSFEETPHNDGKPLELLCDKCHEEVAAEFKTKSIHGQLHESGNDKVAHCHQCHGGHQILPRSEEKSTLSLLNQPTTCGKCHGTEAYKAEDFVGKKKLIERYTAGVHWKAAGQGKPAATCSDCHGSHTIVLSSDRDSPLGRSALLTTCGKCHAKIAERSKEGAHGRTLLHGNLDVPTCTSCHGDHDILSLKVQADGKRSYEGVRTCVWCHGNVRMMKRYGLDTVPVDSYLRDFHARVQKGTGGAAATCADCHDPHNPLPASDPRSTTHLSNRAKICGKCHQETNPSFFMSFSHRDLPTGPDHVIKKFVRVAYWGLIILVVGGMLLHNFIIWFHAFLKKYRHQKAAGRIVRLTAFERLWHWALFLSFTALVITGFTLKFPDSFLFKWFYGKGLSELGRGNIHRVAAVILIVTTVVFMVYQVVNRFGRRWIREMLPGLGDIREFRATMSYYLGMSQERPRVGVFGYVEKAEYWALLWGTAVMVVTGLVLWFPKMVPGAFPSWVIEVSRMIHYYEAILASLSILVWHFFHAIFRPGEYPMDTTWLTGVLTQDEAEERFHDKAIEAQILEPSKHPGPDHK